MVGIAVVVVVVVDTFICSVPHSVVINGSLGGLTALLVTVAIRT